MRIRRVGAVPALVAAIVASMPLSARADTAPTAPCVVTTVDHGASRTYVVVGKAVAPGAVVTTVGCGIVQNGRVVAYFRASYPGGVAAGVWTVPGNLASYQVCGDVYARFADGSEFVHNGCP